MTMLTIYHHCHYHILIYINRYGNHCHYHVDLINSQSSYHLYNQKAADPAAERLRTDRSGPNVGWRRSGISHLRRMPQLEGI